MAYKKGNCEGEGYDWMNSDMGKKMGMEHKPMDKMSEAECEKENFPSMLGYNVVDHAAGRKSETIKITGK